MLDLVEAQFSLDTLKSAFGTTNVEPIVRCHQIPRVVNVPGYTPLIPRIDELFNVQPNIYGTNQEVVRPNAILPVNARLQAWKSVVREDKELGRGCSSR